ncbi:MAG: DUF1800 domain-containing protein [Aquabacterium sp.]|uniref:DUF1800 domain-containing protein n=1 Tax=Aquabacterium sp. TaxID=1872578 RepID=UPI0025BBB7CF|nr:DUF1800 domain-containing protein [Aquabacterium sp.]MBI5926239.1 DUF1800 domain-containing protein [Aquabacterium sp.]
MNGIWRWATLLLCNTLAIFVVGCVPDTSSDKPQDRAQATRFLAQATFGPDEININRLMSIGYEAWIDEQFALQPGFTFREFMTRRNAEIKADNPGTATAQAGPAQIIEAFYTRALLDNAQLRARLAFTLSEIFVISLNDEGLAVRAPNKVAGYMDMLDANLNGSYRELLEAVTKSPAMGHYLTYRGNTKEAPTLGHFPDENYAREVMQLFSIGLYELNLDGSNKLDARGKPIETYASNDIKGLAKVFTGWSDYRGAAYAGIADSLCIMDAPACKDPEAGYHPMMAFPAYHSTSEKSFLGITIPAQDPPDPQDSLTKALDRLASHPNTAPFICRQLIQRLVTSNPSPDYVARVAQRFLNTGGNIKDVVKAILLDQEARSQDALINPKQGKLREPILRLTSLLRAFNLSSPTLSVSSSLLDTAGTTRIPYVSIGNTSDANSWGQTPLYAPSVFNFFRPGYVPPQSQLGSAGLVAPELQITNETTVTGYVNAVLDLLANGIGPSSVADTDGRCGAFTPQVQQYILSLDSKVAANKALQDAAVTCQLETIPQRNVTLQLIEQRAMAHDAGTLAQHVADRLLGGTISDGLRQNVISALDTVPVPQPDGTPTNGQAINSALDKRVWTAIAMVAVSPEFLMIK